MLGKRITAELVKNSALMGTGAAAYRAPNTLCRQDDKPKV